MAESERRESPSHYVLIWGQGRGLMARAFPSSPSRPLSFLSLYFLHRPSYISLYSIKPLKDSVRKHAFMASLEEGPYTRTG
jgi:hypothetical protein